MVMGAGGGGTGSGKTVAARSSSLTESAAPGPSLRTLDFAVVDLETTGSTFRRGHRVTEVAVVRVRGGVVDEIAERIRGRIFVAHNARFDWGFLQEELAQATGDVPDVTALCTVRLARALLPELGRYHLDSVARHFGIPIESRHRAHGDAFAAARILRRLLDAAALQGVADLTGLLGALEAGRGWSRSRRGGSS